VLHIQVFNCSLISASVQLHLCRNRHASRPQQQETRLIPHPVPSTSNASLTQASFSPPYPSTRGHSRGHAQQISPVIVRILRELNRKRELLPGAYLCRRSKPNHRLLPVCVSFTRPGAQAHGIRASAHFKVAVKPYADTVHVAVT
jgi:hypothetical protein